MQTVDVFSGISDRAINSTDEGKKKWAAQRAKCYRRKIEGGRKKRGGGGGRGRDKKETSRRSTRHFLWEIGEKKKKRGGGGEGSVSRAAGSRVT